MPRKEGHEAEEKVSIVRRILKCEISIRAAVIASDKMKENAEEKM